MLVVDLGDLTTAFCGRLLAGLGAAVVRCGDEVDWLRDDEDARLYYRRDVESRSADAAPELSARADVLLTSGRPSELVAAGRDYASLAGARPDLVVVNVAPFGLTGPKAEWRATNLVAASAGGMVGVNGWPGEAPLQPLGLQAYHAAGLHGAIGALLALRVRERCGRGQLVDVSLQESALAAVEHVTGLYRERGEVSRRSGTLHWTRAFQSLPTRGGAVLVSHMGDWDALRDWVLGDGGDAALGEPRWNAAAYRAEHCEELFGYLGEWTSRHVTAELAEAAQLRRLPFAPIADLRDAADHPQLAARAFFDPASIDGTPRRVPRSVPHAADIGGSVPGSRFPAPDRMPDALLPEPAQPLAGVRVLDLTWVVAGPLATRVLADHGAAVTKIERPHTPAAHRRGGVFGNLNRGKRSVVVDMSDAAGRAELRRRIESSDLLIENFSPRVLANWGLDDAALLAINPALKVVHMSGFGHTGPQRDGVSFGPTLQAQLGFTAHMRHPDGRPAGWGYSYSDMVAGYAAALAAIAALRRPEGCIIDLAQLEALASVIGPALIAAARGATVGAIGNASQEGALVPHGVYRCRDAIDGGDRWCAIAVAGDRQWQALLATTKLRLATAGDIDRALTEWTRGRDASEVAEMLQGAGIAAAVVADARDLSADDHLAARGAFVSVPTPEGGSVELDASPIRLSLTPSHIRAPGPLLDEVNFLER